MFFGEINKLQNDIMIEIGKWSSKEKSPIPRKEVIQLIKKQGVKEPTIINALNSLLRKGYIRRSIGTSNKTYYVMLRGV